MSARSKKLIVLWLVFSLVTAWIAWLVRDGATLGDTVVPMGNDSFYHAERMIDTATGSGFYEFDENMHVPEGSWVTWPWAYDYLAGKALGVALAINPSLQPMAFLGWIPVLWVFINVALFIGIANRLGLRIELIACAAIAFALSGAVQILHAFANLDHHFIELTFVLASVYALMRWLASPDNRREAALTGIVLGLAPAFHTGAFILQLPVLITLFLLWLRGEMPAVAPTRSMVIALLVTSLVVLLPSGPFRDLQFSMTTFSWFHGYVAVCTSVAALLMASRPLSRRQFAILAGTSTVLAVPLAGAIVLGGNFLAGNLMVFDLITEVRSPVKQILSANGHLEVFPLYSYLFLLLPVLLVFFAWQIARRDDPVHTAFYVAGVFGLVLLSLQQRLMYFGISALILGTVVLISQLERVGVKRVGVGLITLAAVAVSVQPQLRGQLFANKNAGFSRDYELAYDMYQQIGPVCAAEPGLMIASNNDGHHVRFHGECPVLANNFILTPQHERKVAELRRLLQLTPAAFLQQAPAETRYLFVRLEGLYVVFRGNLGVRSVKALREINPALFMSLAEAKVPPPGFELLAEVRVEDGRDLPIAQIYRVTPATAE